jgi:peptide/nickel transport system permease protein
MELFKKLCQRRTGFTVLVILGVLYGAALFAPFLTPYQTSDQFLTKSYHPPTMLTWKDGGLQVKIYAIADPEAGTYQPLPGQSAPIHFFAKGYSYKLFGIIPMERHLFQTVESQRIYLLGSDATGRDIFSRLLYGSQISLSIGFIGIIITMSLGFLIGGMAGYFGGRVDFVSMRFVELLIAIPGLYLLLALRSALAPYFDSARMYLVIIILLSFIGWAGTARIMRGMVLSIRERAYVQASEALGRPAFPILFRHILPNLASYLLVAATLSIPGYILGEAALSYLGLGIQEPSASWGLMLKEAQDIRVIMMNMWWLFTPGAAIFVTVLAFNILGDELRDLVDPRFRLNVKNTPDPKT